MREYKFRGKRIDNGEWVYGSLVRGVEVDDPNNVTWWIFEDTTAHQMHLVKYQHPIDPATIGQYTGLKDKNGKEIYEGDVVKAKDPYIIDGKERFYICEVVFAECAMFMLKHTYNNYGKVKTRYFGLRDMETEVIGNIYDNPELLKEGLKC